MPQYLLATLAGACAVALATSPAAAQSAAPRTGRLHYEFSQRVDQQRVKVRMFGPDGQEIQTDGPGSTIELPTAMSGQKTLAYSGDFAREEQARGVQMGGGNITITQPGGGGGGGVQRTFRQPSPVVETQYFNLAARTITSLTTIAGATYALPTRPVPAPPAGWQDLPQTRKIAGFQCHKVTVPFRKETYTLWVTTELPFSYSPVPELTPARGVVLALSSDQEEFTATKLTAEPVADADVRPSAQARPVTEAELKDLREKARADMHQRLMEQVSGASQR